MMANAEQPMNWRLTCSSISGLELLEYVSFVTVPYNAPVHSGSDMVPSGLITVHECHVVVVLV